MDKIQLTGIRCYGYIGYLPEEQILGQWFEVNLQLGLDLSAPGQSDRLEDTLDYRAVIDKVQFLTKHSKFALLERLATAIVEEILHSFAQVQEVTIRLSKLAAPIPDFNGTITLEIMRSRQHIRSLE